MLRRGGGSSHLQTQSWQGECRQGDAFAYSIHYHRHPTRRFYSTVLTQLLLVIVRPQLFERVEWVEFYPFAERRSARQVQPLTLQPESARAECEEHTQHHASCQQHAGACVEPAERIMDHHDPTQSDSEIGGLIGPKLSRPEESFFAACTPGASSSLELNGISIPKHRDQLPASIAAVSGRAGQ